MKGQTGPFRLAKIEGGIEFEGKAYMFDAKMPDEPETFDGIAHGEINGHPADWHAGFVGKAGTGESKERVLADPGFIAFDMPSLDTVGEFLSSLPTLNMAGLDKLPRDVSGALPRKAEAYRDYWYGRLLYGRDLDIRQRMRPTTSEDTSDPILRNVAGQNVDMRPGAEFGRRYTWVKGNKDLRAVPTTDKPRSRTWVLGNAAVR